MLRILQQKTMTCQHQKFFGHHQHVHFFLQNHLELVSEPLPMNSCRLWLKQVWDVEHRWYEVPLLHLNTPRIQVIMTVLAVVCMLCKLCRLASYRQDTPYSQNKDHGGRYTCDSFSFPAILLRLFQWFQQVRFGCFGGFALVVPVVLVVLFCFVSQAILLPQSGKIIGRFTRKRK